MGIRGIKMISDELKANKKPEENELPPYLNKILDLLEKIENNTRKV